MKVLGIYGSPRKGGNSDLLLDRVLEGVKSAGAEISTVYARNLKMAGCQECGGCDKTGVCAIDDDMTGVYPLLQEADIIFLSTPIFFYAVPAQVKALIDRSQAMWSKRKLAKPMKEWSNYTSGKGYLIACGATKGKNLFEGLELMAKYFFDALDMSYEGSLTFRQIEGRAAILAHPTAMDEAFEFGRRAVTGNK
ncbi:MAG: flavodoxin family protein [Deltaproteobacteria bacterium]|nr:flavodoxin family protein [Deltaproteobacteria bacterium]